PLKSLQLELWRKHPWDSSFASLLRMTSGGIRNEQEGIYAGLRVFVVRIERFGRIGAVILASKSHPRRARCASRVVEPWRPGRLHARLLALAGADLLFRRHRHQRLGGDSAALSHALPGRRTSDGQADIFRS